MYSSLRKALQEGNYFLKEADYLMSKSSYTDYTFARYDEIASNLGHAIGLLVEVDVTLICQNNKDEKTEEAYTYFLLLKHIKDLVEGLDSRQEEIKGLQKMDYTNMNTAREIMQKYSPSNHFLNFKDIEYLAKQMNDFHETHRELSQEESFFRMNHQEVCDALNDAYNIYERIMSKD